MSMALVVTAIVLLLADTIILLLLVRRDNAGPATTALTNLQENQSRQERLIREEFAQARAENSQFARENRQELAAAFHKLSDELIASVGAFGLAQSSKLDSFSQQLREISAEIARKQDTNRENLDQLLRAIAADTRNQQTDFRNQITGAFDALGQRVSDGIEIQKNQLESSLSRLTQAVTDAGGNNSEAIERLRTSVEERLTTIQADNTAKLELIRSNVDRRLSESGTTLAGSIETLSNKTAAAAESLRTAVDSRLASIQSDNNRKLEEMRNTVDEKLHSTLEQRLGDGFRIVSERLELVHAGLGEMRTLASGVGDLKKVLMNIRARGNWGEVQVSTLLEQILTPDQYSKNVRTNPDSNERVEFAIRLPGRDSSGETVWLPIDSKFPNQDYERLIQAADAGDASGVSLHATALEENICSEAKKIVEKYVNPPHTTDFAILFLPTEGLFAEILRRPGICERTLSQRIVLAGPTTLAALLNSLRMGFQTIAIEKRTAEVWETLGAVKTEFGRFGNSLATVEKKLHEASNKLGDVRTRQRVLTRKLRDVQELPTADTARVLELTAISIAAVADDDVNGDN